jgi:hypothetical protein
MDVMKRYDYSERKEHGFSVHTVRDTGKGVKVWGAGKGVGEPDMGEEVASEGPGYEGGGEGPGCGEEVKVRDLGEAWGFGYGEGLTTEGL